MIMYQKYFKRINVDKSTGVKFYRYRFPKAKRHILAFEEHSYIGRILALTLHNPRWAIDWKYTLSVVGKDQICRRISDEFSQGVRDSLSECNAVFVCTDTGIPVNCADVLKPAMSAGVPVFVFTRVGVKIPEEFTPTKVFRYDTELQLGEQLLWGIQSLNPSKLRSVSPNPKRTRFMGERSFRCPIEDYDAFKEAQLQNMESKIRAEQPEKQDIWRNVCVD